MKWCPSRLSCISYFVSCHSKAVWKTAGDCQDGLWDGYPSEHCAVTCCMVRLRPAPIVVIHNPHYTICKEKAFQLENVIFAKWVISLGLKLHAFRAIITHKSNLFLMLYDWPGYITVTSYWAFVQAHINENIKSLRHWPLWEESSGRNFWMGIDKSSQFKYFFIALRPQAPTRPTRIKIQTIITKEQTRHCTKTKQNRHSGYWTVHIAKYTYLLRSRTVLRLFELSSWIHLYTDALTQ